MAPTLIMLFFCFPNFPLISSLYQKILLARLVSAGEDGCHEILWDIIRQNRNLPNILEPSVEERSAMQVTPELFQDSVVAPWYRGMMTDQV